MKSRSFLLLIFFYAAVLAQVHAQVYLNKWNFAEGDRRESLLIQPIQVKKGQQMVTLPHRVLKPDQSLWYYQRIQLDQSHWLQLDADDGAQVFYQGQNIKTTDGKHFLLTATADSVDLYVRVLNNAMFGGLRQAILMDQLPNLTVACDASLVWPYVQEIKDAYIVKCLLPGANAVQLRYIYDRETPLEIQPSQRDGDLYEFEIPKKAGQNLVYSISQNGSWLDSFWLKLASPDSTLQFGIWADSQGGWKVFEALSQQMFAKNMAFTVGVGDLTPNGRDTCQWKHLIQAMGKKAAEVPTYFIPGNHDYDDYYDDLIPHNFQHYIRKDNFFSWTAGDAIFLALDPNETFPIGIKGEQMRWLKKELRSKAWKNARWRFLFIHQPPYSQGWEGYSGDAFIRDFVEQHAEKHGIDFVISGHSHCYERLSKQFGQQSTHFFIVGGAGGGLEEASNSASPQMEVVIKKHHYGVVKVNQGRVEIVIYGLEGEILDTFSAEKDIFAKN